MWKIHFILYSTIKKLCWTSRKAHYTNSTNILLWYPRYTDIQFPDLPATASGLAPSAVVQTRNVEALHNCDTQSFYEGLRWKQAKQLLLLPSALQEKSKRSGFPGKSWTALSEQITTSWCTGKHRARGTEHRSGGGGNNTKYLGEDRWNYLFLVTITTAAIQKGRML